MTTRYRKLQDTWSAIDHMRISAGLKSREWKQSYNGVKAALAHVGLTMVTTEDEFANLTIPVKKGTAAKQYMDREVRVSRNRVISKPTAIDKLLSGESGLLTDQERDTKNRIKSDAMRLARPTGTAHSNKVETTAIDALDELIGTSCELYGEHLIENRLADKAYCLCNADREGAVFVPDQVKTSRAMSNGRVTFHAQHGVMSVQHMISILRADMSLTCIGLNHEGQLDVVWIFHGEPAIRELQTFDSSQRLSPRLHLKISATAAKPFNQFINKSEYRFDVKENTQDCHRLLKRRIEIVQTGGKRSLPFLRPWKFKMPPRILSFYGFGYN